MHRNNKVYLVTYSGLWLGGKCVVVAEDEKQAIILASVHENTCRFENVEVKELPSFGVVYNDNGEY
tara:strand:+ start:174 stop:371 length:198 start_codon:yes stop_codon:yes gene_type:complete